MTGRAVVREGSCPSVQNGRAAVREGRCPGGQVSGIRIYPGIQLKVSTLLQYLSPSNVMKLKNKPLTFQIQYLLLYASFNISASLYLKI